MIEESMSCLDELHAAHGDIVTLVTALDRWKRSHARVSVKCGTVRNRAENAEAERDVLRKEAMAWKNRVAALKARAEKAEMALEKIKVASCLVPS